MSAPLRERTMALAGLFQACALVRDIAHQGSADPAALSASLDSIRDLDAPSTEAIFGGVDRLAMGLRVLREQLGPGSRGRDPELTAYAASVMYLERRLMASERVVAHLRTALSALRAPLETPPEPDWVESVATLYVETVGTLGPRIMVRGEPVHLETPGHPELVRALLLAAIRAAVLWRQLGGGRIGLLLGRAGYARWSERLLEER